jgi:hypothetical protein
MPLKLEPEIYDGPYVFFNLLRGEIAKAAGIIEHSHLFGSPEDGIDWSHITKITDYFGYWSEKPKDPIWYLLAHSDRAGIIKSEHVSELIPRLSSIKLDMVTDTPNWKKAVTDLISRLKTAESNKEDLIFK